MTRHRLWRKSISVILIQCYSKWTHLGLGLNETVCEVSQSSSSWVLSLKLFERIHTVCDFKQWALDRVFVLVDLLFNTFWDLYPSVFSEAGLVVSSFATSTSLTRDFGNMGMCRILLLEKGYLLFIVQTPVGASIFQVVLNDLVHCCELNIEAFGHLAEGHLMDRMLVYDVDSFFVVENSPWLALIILCISLL